MGLGLGGALLILLGYFLLGAVEVSSTVRTVILGLFIGGVMKGYNVKNRSEFLKSWRGIMIILMIVVILPILLVVGISRGGK